MPPCCFSGLSPVTATPLRPARRLARYTVIKNALKARRSDARGQGVSLVHLPDEIAGPLEQAYALRPQMLVEVAMFVQDETWRLARQVHLMKDLAVVPFRVNRDQVEWPVLDHKRAPIHGSHRHRNHEILGRPPHIAAALVLARARVKMMQPARQMDADASDGRR